MPKAVGTGLKGKAMRYAVYKLSFLTGVHFGNGMLNQSGFTFQADTLFSALYIEALKMGTADRLYEAVKAGRLLFSDAFPYVKERLLIPKPMIYVESGRKGDSEAKKKFKKLSYIPVEDVGVYLAGDYQIEENTMEGFGAFRHQTMAAVRGQEDTLPYHVGTYYYGPDRGLYLILAYEGEREKELAAELLRMVSLVGIGGKRASGLGRFTVKEEAMPEKLEAHLRKKTGCSLLLSAALPTDQELEAALEGASYLLEKRSGFVASADFSEEQRKKRDLYVFSAGSCFRREFAGDVYDVAAGGSHPVYRCAKPLFMGV